MPRGYGKEAAKISSKVRSAVASALGILDTMGTPLKVLLAREFQRDPVRTLQAVARFLPTEARVEVIDVAKLHLAAVQQLQALPNGMHTHPPVIDVTPERQPLHLPDSDKERELLDRLLS